jgi:hypothetical protein
MYDNIYRGTYLVGGKELYFRSGWEYKYALYLEWLKNKKEIKDWSFEPRIFNFSGVKGKRDIVHGTTRYIPDFEIINNNGKVEYHEVKGRMDSKSKTKIRRFQEYYPEYKFVLIEAEFMKALKRNEKLWS